VAEALGQPLPQVVQALGPGVTVLAARPAWVRVRSAEGTVLFEGVMDAGDHYAVPQMEVPPSIHIGEAGSVYFAVDGTTYGPAGSRGQVLRKVGLDVADLTRTYVAADIGGDLDLVRVLAELKGAPVVD
jgi:cytoskeleton protein RodZ